MNDRPINVLLIEDEPGDARLVREILAYADSHQFNLECTDRLSAGLERLARGGIDVVLLDLGLPDSRGLDTLAALHALESAVPVVVETGLDDEALALEAVQSGAQDYLIKGHFSHDVLARTIRYAIERKHAERALRESEHRAVSMLEELKVTQESLIQAEKLSAIGELVAGVAHELNNPLSTIVGFAELLLTRDPEPEARQYLERIQSDGWRAARVVANLRTFAQKREVQATVLDVNEVLTDVLKLKSYSLKVSTIQVEEELAADLPKVLADTGQLQIVFLNLINNAQSAMGEAYGRGTLWIKTARVGDNVRVTIADEGPGIEPENLSKIFDSFFTTKDVDKGMGMGLGLSI
ncbi:MAG: response regulator, partial [Dehalococcoidia bacterium]